ncbi:MAG: glutathione synthase [Betaproteobacteria bacterium]|nr:glutathione synthase [Betaproteobacteria bacterium]
MRIAFLIDPPESFKIYKDSTYAMMREAAKRGHELHVFEQNALAWRAGQVGAATQRLHLTSDQSAWFRLDAAQPTALKDFDAVLMRKDPPFDMEYVYSTYLLELAQEQGARVFNNPRAIRNCNEKLTIARFPQFTAPTLVARDAALIHDFLAEHGDIILKPLDGMGGTSVFRVSAGDPNLNVIIETITHYGSRTVMAQRYIPEISAGDKRILLIGGKPVPHALARIPKAGETRGNLAAGGTGVARELTARDREIAETLAPQLFSQGLLLVGLDVIGSFLTEVNVTSPTCFQEITEQTGFNVAGMMIDALERAVE